MSRYTGTTPELAEKKALAELKVSKDEVVITVIDEGKKGFLGIGKKDAVIEVTLKQQAKEEVEVVELVEKISQPQQPKTSASLDETNEEKQVEKEAIETTKVLENLEDEEALKELGLYLTKISTELGVPSLVRMERTKDVIIFHLETKKQGILIGKHGKILNALQYLAQVFVHRVAANKLSVVVNVGDYREKRQGIVESLAKRTAKKVQETKQPVFLEPMPAFERKLIHAILSENPYVSTHSEGEEPYRYLVVEPSKKNIF